MKKILLNNILLFGLVFLLAYTLGISIINLINDRLQNISIQMPKVEVRLPNHLNREPVGYDADRSTGPICQKGAGVPTCPTIQQTSMKCGPPDSPKEQCQPDTCSADSQCNRVYGAGANRCVNGRCQCRFGTGAYCHLQPTYYLDPKLMTPEQIVKFKNRARLDRMTLQDYKNWLSLFEYDLQSLPLIHRKNYWRLKRGDEIAFVPLCSGDIDPAALRSPDNTISPDNTCGTIKNDVGNCGTVIQTGAGSCEVPATGGRGPGGQIPGLPDDVRMYRIWGDRQLAASGIRPETDDLIEVKLKVPAVEADTSHNYMFTDEHMDTTGYVRNVNDFSQPLAWSNYANAFESNKKYVEYDDDKMRRFKTTPVASWFQNSAIELSDLVESTYFDPNFRTC